jgi:hypothetical protein
MTVQSGDMINSAQPCMNKLADYEFEFWAFKVLVYRTPVCSLFTKLISIATKDCIQVICMKIGTLM